MHLFADYIQPFTIWLQNHPHWALVLTFVISFTESLAIIGSIIPGSVTMTAIGILAGSGVMRIDLTLLAAILGAIAGDSASYMLGYMFSDKLVHFWPFKRYPHWLSYGKEFFAKHGGKSVLIGRFVGPLRSIIPVIAGMMHMSHLHFYIANIISAIAWSFLYVLPGVLIGAASSELSPESATRLFILVLLILGGIWLASMLIKWLFLHVSRILRTRLHDFWFWSKKHPHLARYIQRITPEGENNHYATAGLSLLLIVSMMIFLLAVILASQQSWIAGINQPVHLVLQSIRTIAFDSFFIAVEQLCSSNITLSIIILFIAMITAWHRDWRTLLYWLSLCLSCSILLYLTQSYIESPRPTGLLDVKSGFSFPATQLTYAAALFSALLLYINSYKAARWKPLFNSLIPAALLLAGFSDVYLGDYWLTDVIAAYFGGFTLTLAHWLLYRRIHMVRPYSVYLGLWLTLVVVVAATVSFIYNFNEEMRSHQPYFAQYVFTDELWWAQKKPLLPVYRVNRLGRPVNLFNLQYAGSVNRLESSLIAFGWKKQNEPLYKAILKRLNNTEASEEIPLITQLYLNRKPVLIMTFDPQDGSPDLVLRLWRSNYHLQHYRQPIWIGSVHNEITIPRKANDAALKPALSYITAALPEYTQRIIPVAIKKLDKIPLNVEPKLLLIKEP